MFKDEKVEPNMQKGGEAGLHNLGLFAGKYKVVKLVLCYITRRGRILKYLNILVGSMFYVACFLQGKYMVVKLVLCNITRRGRVLTDLTDIHRPSTD